MEAERRAAWLKAAVVAPSISVTALVTLGVLFGLVDPEVGGRAMNWLHGMAHGGVVALMCAGSLLVVDVALERGRVRRLPTGRRAWLTSGSMPIALVAAYQLLAPSDDW